MSMMAKFVQISPDLLAELIEEPDRVSELFMEMPPARSAAQVPPALHAQALARLPQLMAGSLERLDPSIRAGLEERLKNFGVSIEDLSSGRGADAILKLMERARGNLAAAQASTGPGLKGRGPDISLDKAWHGVHYLLCGEIEPGATLLSQAVLGGTEIGDDDSGYGPARYFSPRQVADASRELSDPALESAMRPRFDPKQMNGLGIYPGGWDTAGAFDWLSDEFHRLRDFYTDAATRQFAIVTCLV